MTLRTAASLALLGLSVLPATAAPPSVVTDIPVVGAMVAQVMGQIGAPVVLMEDGGDPHDYQLRPSEARTLSRADLLVWVGPELSPWLDRAAKTLSDEGTLRLLSVDGTHLRDYDSAAEAEHDHGHDAHDHDHQDSDGHDHSGVDPHAWLDPANGALWLQAIAEMLSSRDPENAAVYQANAAEGQTLIAEADARIATMMTPVRDRRFVVFHDAYGYFTDHFGLAPAIAVSLGDASTPSAARLKSIRDALAEANPVCAFPEPNHDPRLLDTAVEGSDVRRGDALSPEGYASGSDATYPDILRAMGQTLSDCLSDK